MKYYECTICRVDVPWGRVIRVFDPTEPLEIQEKYFCGWVCMLRYSTLRSKEPADVPE